MFEKHLETTENNRKVIYLYLNRNYEISNDLYITKDNDTLINSVRNYLNNNQISYKKRDIYLVIDDVIVGKLNKKLLSKKLNYLEYIRYGKTPIEEELERHPSLKFIDLLESNGIIENMKLDNYLQNVVISEMPNVMEIESLKAAAVIARSYCIKRILNNKRIREINEIQIYKNKEELKKILDKNYKEYISLVRKAIKETDDEIIKYKDDIIECYTHYKNCGKTEDSIAILKKKVPYLKSVISFEKDDFLRYRRISNRHLSKLLGLNINKNTKVETNNKTNGNNNRYVIFDNKVFDGMELAKRLSLISYNYDIEIKEDYTIFITKGCGVNLGLSKCGSQELARIGYSYRDILKHYYPNTYIDKVELITD